VAEPHGRRVIGPEGKVVMSRQYQVGVTNGPVAEFASEAGPVYCARHSTIDLTMNVYTHVEMDDLASDLEGMPSVVSECDCAPALIKPPTTSPPIDLPDDLASLASNPSSLRSVVASWKSLPEHVRQTIVALAR
jgi:hypothetical protein